MLKPLHLLHERLIKAALSFYTTKVANLASSVLYYGGTSSSKLMGTVRFSRPGLHSYGAKDQELSPDPPEKGWSLTGRDGFSPWLPKRYENISL